MPEQTKPSAGAYRAARVIDKAIEKGHGTVEHIVEIIDHETGVAELLEAAPRISTDGDGDVWMHALNVGINLSAQGGPIIKKNLLAWAEKMKQAIAKTEAADTNSPEVRRARGAM